ncbi:Uu.00g049260.m01.CDS01 [Anthostomella pinea]|uniref:histidine kinase n=1 Tax=Anthostomella pinea TaxID=933095 RepID=A0AAI8V6U8_9PEZI|nr:Uu.00g049260.m01.CDS01 [Anthostomella pinea]
MRKNALSEAARERELLRYDPTLLSNFTFNDKGTLLPDSQLRTSPDSVLTSLAQLGACRTKTARSLISIFDQKYQYIIAEATPDMPLLPSLPQEERNGEVLYLCQTAIPRAHGACDWVLTNEDDGQELPVTIVRDLGTDARFRERSYCREGSPARFYAAAPIQSSKGITIGVYCVLDTEPRSEEDAINDRVDIVVRDTARTIKEYLESRRIRQEHKRSERMIRGVGSFVSDQNTLLDWSRDNRQAANGCGTVTTKQPQPVQQGNLNIEVSDPSTGTPSVASVARYDSASASELIDVVGDRSEAPIEWASPAAPKASAVSTPLRTTVNETASVKQIFSRAAALIRESIEVDEVVFFSASPGTFGALVDTAEDGDQSSDPLTASSSSDEPNSPSADETAGGFCHVLGNSNVASSKNQGIPNISAAPTALPRRLLTTFLKKYPRGKVFNYDECGVLQSNDFSEDSAQSSPSPASTRTFSWSSQNRRERTYSARQRGAELLSEVFPGLRSLVFVSVWDSKKERWFAGGFAYTLSPTRILTTTGELSYLKAFAMLAMSEMHRFETSRSHQAQMDVLSSLSHELRSPLHGVILSVELLAGTRLDTFQGNVTNTLETCGRTLLDTVDHLLDFSKVNNYIASRRPGMGRARGLRDGGASIESGMKSQLSDIRLDVLVEEVIESVFAGFQRMSDGGPVSTQDQNGESIPSLPHVRVCLDIESNTALNIHASPGAIRRIVMNLFGNSLKYTERGWIRVSLSRDADNVKRRGMRQRMVRLVVSDTGKGISKEYLANDLFRPFSQEDRLSPGTGLGLSLVRKIVTSLRGEISIKSQVGAGTTATVLLPLPPTDQALPKGKEDEEFDRQKRMLKGLRVRLVGLCQVGNHADCETSEISGSDCFSSVGKVCKEWFQMETTPASQGFRLAPDIILCTELVLDHNRSALEGRSCHPIVVICPNIVAAHARALSTTPVGDRRIYEFISQPTGPRKLAKVLLLAFQRWLDTQDSSATSSVLTPASSLHFEAPTMTSSYSSLGSSDPAYPVPAPGRTKSYFHTQTHPLSQPHREPLTPSTGCLPPPSPPIRTSPVEYLLVDDNPINLRILCAYMKKLGHPYATAVDGQEAVDLFKACPNRFVCILMDISMPRLDGMAATQQIRAHERDQNLKACAVFALSGLASTSAQKDAFESGIDLFLTKPVRLQELDDILSTRGLL